MLVWRQWLGRHWILGVWVEGPWVILIVVVPSIQCFRNSMGWACYASSKAGWRSVVAVVVWSRALRGAWLSTWALLSGSVSSKLSKRPTLLPPRRSSLTGIQRPSSFYEGRILQDELQKVCNPLLARTIYLGAGILSHLDQFSAHLTCAREHWRSWSCEHFWLLWHF